MFQNITWNNPNKDLNPAGEKRHVPGFYIEGGCQSRKNYIQIVKGNAWGLISLYSDWVTNCHMGTF